MLNNAGNRRGMRRYDALGVVAPGSLPWGTDRAAANREYGRARRAAGVDRDKQRARDLLKKYGITEADYDEMRAAQGYRCAICGAHEDDLPRIRTGRPRTDGSPPKLAPPLVIDHCHATGRVRGLLCSSCNYGLGHFKDKPGSLVAAVGYLVKGGSGQPEQLALDLP